MAFGASTISDIGGSVSDLFAGFGAEAQGSLKAQGLRIDAQGNIIKAQGDIAEGQEYSLAADLAAKNEQFATTSAAIKEAQNARSITMAIGGEKADVAGAGFAQSGSALDLLRDSASQGALTQAVLHQQGLVTEAGYQEQQQSFTTMANAANTAAGEEESIATQTDQLATQTQQAANTQGIGDFVGSAFKAAAAVATIALV